MSTARHHSGRTAALAGVVLVALLACAPGEPPPPRPSGRVSGRVVLAENAPRAGIPVSLTGPGGVRGTASDADGAYAFEGVGPGAYELQAALAETVEGTVRTSVVVTAHPVVAADLLLTPLGAVAGDVRLVGLPAAPGLTVTVSGGGLEPRSALTDGEGAFRLAGLPPGVYTVVAAASSTLEGTLEASVAVSPGGEARVSFSFSPLGSIVGRAPPGARCRLSGAERALETLAGADGAFTFPDPASWPAGGLRPGAYLVSVTVPETVEGTVEVEVVVGRGEVVLPGFDFTRLGAIVGRLGLTGLRGEAGLEVTAGLPGGPLLAVRTEADGAFSLTGLPPGAYLVSATVGFTVEGARTAIAQVPEGGQAVVALDFSPYGLVTGRAPPGAGCRLVGGAVDLSAAAGSDGTFSLPDPAALPAGGLPPGAYRLTVSLPETVEGSVSVDVEVGRGEAPVGAIPFTRLGTILGELVLTGLPPEAGLEVIASVEGGPPRSAHTDERGAFSFARLPPGRYRLSAPVPYTVAPQEATTVEVAPGASATATLTLAPYGTVEASVLVEGGPDLGGSPCRLVGQGHDLGSLTDAQGRCLFPGPLAPELPGLPPGEYRVSAQVAGTVEGEQAVTVQVGRGPALAPQLRFVRLGNIWGNVILLGFPLEREFRVTAQLDGGPLLETVTGPDRSFTFGDVAPGAYAVTVHIPHTQQERVDSVVLVEPGRWSTVDFFFMPSAVIRGSVLLGSAPPPTGTSCVLSRSGREQRASTAPDGTFGFPAPGGGPQVSEGSYLLSVSLPSTREGALELAVEVERLETVLPALRFTPEGGLTGRVLLAGGAPAVGALVWVEATGDLAMTGPDGAYRFPRLVAGTHRLRAALAGHQAGALEGLVVAWNEELLAPTMTLAEDLPGQPSTGRLVGSASLAGLGRREGVVVAVEGLGLSAVSGADGTWVIDGVPPGVWPLTLTWGERAERAPAAVSLPGTDGFLLDERLYPIGDVELQGGRRICVECRPDRSGLLADGRGLVVERETRLLAVPVDGGPVILLAEDHLATWEVTPAATGAPCHVLYASVALDLMAVPCAGGPALRLAPGGGPGRFSPDGRRYLADGSDGLIWYADLERGEARPVAAGRLGEPLGPDHMAYGDTQGDVFGSLAWADGAAVPLARSRSTVVPLDGGARLLVFPWLSGGGNLGGALVGPVVGPLQAIVDPAEGLLISSWSLSPDQRAVALAVSRLGVYEHWVVVSSTLDGRRIATLPGGSSLGRWSPDSRVYVGIGASPSLVLLDGSAAPALPCLPERFSDDGLLAACRGADQGAERLYLLDTRDWRVVASQATAVPSTLLGFTPDGAAFWAGDALGLHRLEVATGAGASLSAPGHLGAAFSPDRRWIGFGTPDWRLHVAPASGGPAVTVNPPELPGYSLGFLGVHDLVSFRSGQGLYLAPASGGPLLRVGEAPSWSLAPSGDAISWRAPDGVLWSAPLPPGDAVQAATGVGWFGHVQGGVMAYSLADDELLAGPEVGPLRSLGAGTAIVASLPEPGRVLVVDRSGTLSSARVADAALLPLASCADVQDPRGSRVHRDRLLFACSGLLYTVPTGGGPVTPSVRANGALPDAWVDDRHFFVSRDDAPPPCRFQNGTYLVSVP